AQDVSGQGTRRPPPRSCVMVRGKRWLGGHVGLGVGAQGESVRSRRADGLGVAPASQLRTSRPQSILLSTADVSQAPSTFSVARSPRRGASGRRPYNRLPS